ncbi:MAG: hypothetical protein AB1768_18535 [Pseudomonadota bacterium]|jgi:retron-type reverse transcriptase
MSEIPVHPHPRRLADWINPTEAKKVHSLIDKIYQRKNLEMAWERVRANRGSGDVDGQSVGEFAEQANEQLNRLRDELKAQRYQPQPVRQVRIPKAGKPGEYRTLGIPSIYDRVCQQALLNRLEPIFATLAQRRRLYATPSPIPPNLPSGPISATPDANCPAYAPPAPYAI